MKSKLILKYFTSGIILLFSVVITAQEKNKELEKKTEKNTHMAVQAPPKYPQRYGLRLGADLFRITRSMYDKTYNGFEVVGDYRLNKKMFAVAELGRDKLNKTESTYGFTTDGTYLRIGVDYNLHENWLDREDMIYVGGRYGFSSFSQTLDWYKPYSTNGYFDNPAIPVNKKYSGLSAHWVEFVAGIKTRVFDNVFMGFSLRLTGLISQKQPDDFENLYIPGYNRKYSGAIGVGFNYTVSYFIPLYKSNKKAFTIPENDVKYDLEGNKIESEELKMIQENKQKAIEN
ncbi:DUF6048 family protein [Myroides sp. WP-1]|uniref:DUF6048 family protein n=1 Tax=Myroides sp. WP-1 TaxID=2759944 RepID=UPI0015FB61B9|nr:DUF6048 family protein [Myroides sp. WP-1]MBB1139889.1 hypothetical protein [Myroides sp. WP-1]